MFRQANDLHWSSQPPSSTKLSCSKEGQWIALALLLFVARWVNILCCNCVCVCTKGRRMCISAFGVLVFSFLKDCFRLHGLNRLNRIDISVFDADYCNCHPMWCVTFCSGRSFSSCLFFYFSPLYQTQTCSITVICAVLFLLLPLASADLFTLNTSEDSKI